MNQNSNLPAAPKPQIMAGGTVAALIPQSMDEAFRVSQAIALSGLAPKGIDKAEQIMVAIMAGAELGLAPFQSLQSFAVVNGRPTLWGDGLLAVVRGRGVKVKEWLDGEGDQMVAHCLCTRPDTGEEIERAFSVADAKKAGLWGKAGPWQQYPKRMLQMRARALSLRDGCADMLRGIQVREEVEDYQHVRDVTPSPPDLKARLEARRQPATEGFNVVQAETAPAHNAETGEVDADWTEPTNETPSAPPQADGGEQQEAQPQFEEAAPQAHEEAPAQPGDLTLRQRADAFLKRVADAPTTIKLKAIHAAAAGLRKDLDGSDPELLIECDQAFNDRFAALEDAEKSQ